MSVFKEVITNTSHDVDRKALENLVIDNPDLERLEILLDQFNIFEVMGAVRQELRHSDFLAFLLDPQQNYGLGDAFLRRLLQRVLITVQDKPLPVTLVDLDVWSFNQVRVQREWRNIDILLTDESHRLAIIIENKIDSSEHANQLHRYYELVQHQYTNWNVLGIYLTPDGETPSHENYLPVDYSLICTTLEGLAESRMTMLGSDVLTVIRHYTQMLRRHIMNDSEIAELCRRIYQKHHRALDLIYEHRPDRQEAIQDILEELIQRTPGLLPEPSSKTSIRFWLSRLDAPVLKAGNGWTSSGRMLLFEFGNRPDNLKLFLMIGPGPQETRQKLFLMAQQPPFKTARKTLPDKWCIIYQHTFLNAEVYEDTSNEEIEAKIKKQWAAFWENNFPEIEAKLKEQDYLF